MFPQTWLITANSVYILSKSLYVYITCIRFQLYTKSSTLTFKECLLAHRVNEESHVSVYTDLASGSCMVPVRAEGYQSWCRSWQIPSVLVTETGTIRLQFWCLPTMHLNQLVTAYLSVHFQKLINIQKYFHNCLSQMLPNILSIIKRRYAWSETA